MKKWWICMVALAVIISIMDLAIYGMETETEWKELERIEHMYE